MSFVDATGLTQAVAEIKAFCTNAFAALTHYHKTLGDANATVLTVNTTNVSVMEGSDTSASGTNSHAEGHYTTANGYYSHAEGDGTTASGVGAHAEGYYGTATGGYAHVEGSNTTASGSSAHAEGYSTSASGGSSHAEGSYTKASSFAQHASGKYNVEDTHGTYAEIVGNGDSSARSNARTLDWDGNAWHAGEVTATETVTSGGTTTTKSHNLTEKADLAVVESRSKCWYGECTTAAATAAKVVTCSGFELVKGAMIAVHFSNTNTADEATMNVNSTGAKRIATGNTISGQDNFWYAGEIVMFTYDGTYWRPANMAGINALRDSLPQMVLLGETMSTSYVEINADLSDTEIIVLSAGYKSPNKRELASTMFPKSILINATTSSLPCETYCAAEPNVYAAHAYYSSGKIYLKSVNSSYCYAKLYKIVMGASS